MPQPEAAPGAPLHVPAAFPRGYHVLVTAAAAMVVVAGMRAFASSIGPIFLALIIVVVVSPVHAGLRRRGAPPWVALLGLTAVSFGILLVTLAALIWSISELVGLLSSEAYTAQMVDIRTEAADLLEQVGVTGDDLEQALGRLDFGAVAGQISSALSSLLSLTSAIGLPSGTDDGLRVGVNELVRWGARPDDMAETADLVAAAIRTDHPEELAPRVTEFRRRFDTISFTL